MTSATPSSAMSSKSKSSSSDSPSVNCSSCVPHQHGTHHHQQPRDGSRLMEANQDRGILPWVKLHTDHVENLISNALLVPNLLRLCLALILQLLQRLVPLLLVNVHH